MPSTLEQTYHTCRESVGNQRNDGFATEPFFDGIVEEGKPELEQIAVPFNDLKAYLRVAMQGIAASSVRSAEAWWTQTGLSQRAGVVRRSLQQRPYSAVAVLALIVALLQAATLGPTPTNGSAQAAPGVTNTKPHSRQMVPEGSFISGQQLDAFRASLITRIPTSVAYDADLTVGGQLAGTVDLFEITASLGQPLHYRYAVLNGKKVLVDPRTRTIVALFN